MGRDEDRTGEMWNSVTRVLLVSAGLDPVHELPHWPSPKWDAGVAIESPPGAPGRQARTSDVIRGTIVRCLILTLTLRPTNRGLTE